MPHQFDLTLECSLPPKGLGYLLHGAIYKLISEMDPELGDKIHGKSQGEAGPKPIAIFSTPCQGGLVCQLRVLDESLTPLLANCLSQGVQSQQGFGEGLLTGRLVGLKQNTKSYNQLLAEALEQAAPKKILLNFETATAVSGGGQHWPLPVPLLLWRGLLRRWQEYSPLPLEEALRTWWEEWLWCESYQARPKTVFLGPKKGVFQGFVGRAVYEFKPQADPNLRRQTAALAQFAQEVGVGVNTSFGCGVVKAKVLS